MTTPTTRPRPTIRGAGSHLLCTFPPPCHHWGRSPVVGGADGRGRMPVERQYGRGAEMLTARTYFGLQRRDMCTLLGVRESTYQRWENGDDPIPVTVWDDVDKLHAKFDADVQGVLDRADAGETVVRVWRGRNEHQPLFSWWLRVVGDARRRNPAITPRFPEDEVQG